MIMDDTDSKERREVGVHWRGVALITVAALALYAGFRVLPTGTNLRHSDFQATGVNALEMCDPARPQFIPVVEVRSPVRMELSPSDGRVPAVGAATRFKLTLSTAGGSPIGPVDLLTVHTRKLHLLVVDPSLTDYQHLHPEPGAKPGEWFFTHTPLRSGAYRVFVDFTPVATGRGLYAFNDYPVPGDAAVVDDGRRETETRLGGEVATGRWRFRLATREGTPVRAGVPVTLVFSGVEVAGGAVPLGLVMDAYAHLVAFDKARSGFAHLHPRGETSGEYAVRPLDPRAPKLFFALMIPKAGDYVIWTQVNLAGRDIFLPFRFAVTQ